MYTVLLPNLLRPNVKFIVSLKVDIFSKKLHTKKCFEEKSRVHVNKVFFLPHLSRGILNMKFPTDIMSWNVYSNSIVAHAQMFQIFSIEKSKYFCWNLDQGCKI